MANVTYEMNKKISRATKTPWVSKRYGGGSYVIMGDRGETNVAYTRGMGLTDRRDAALICRAVNNHNRLVEALEKFTLLNREHYRDIAGLIDNANDVLKKVKKYKPQ